MEAAEIYRAYFGKKYSVISGVLQYYKESGKKIALWGAGLRGKAFLEIFDPGCSVIDFVYDIDSKKYGTVLKFGHRIVDYRERRADVVVVANTVLEFEIVHTLRASGSEPEMINLDNIILGDLDIDEIIVHRKPDLKPVRDVKICALVIGYHPGSEVVEHISSYSRGVDYLYFYDNSEKRNKELEDSLSKMENAEYIFKGENLGLCVPINEAFYLAREREMDWLITFDQDSVADAGMISRMREFANSSECNGSIAIIAPSVNEIDRSMGVKSRYYTYYDRVIQSGAMHRLAAIEKIGPYNEDLFIDEVDYEYCVRCRMQGYHIVKLDHALLMHNRLDDGVERKLVNGKMIRINKYSPMRYYYRYRNALYCYDKYWDVDPIYGLDCLSTIETLNNMVNYDDDSETKLRAMEKAKRDYENGFMGKCTDFG